MNFNKLSRLVVDIRCQISPRPIGKTAEMIHETNGCIGKLSLEAQSKSFSENIEIKCLLARKAKNILVDFSGDDVEEAGDDIGSLVGAPEVIALNDIVGI